MLACDRCGSARLWQFTPPSSTDGPAQTEGVYLCAHCRALVIRTRPPGLRFGDSRRLASRRQAVHTEARPVSVPAWHERRDREAPAERRDPVAVEHR